MHKTLSAPPDHIGPSIALNTIGKYKKRNNQHQTALFFLKKNLFFIKTASLAMRKERE